jgi:membrane-associated phospholipid phosphatase
MCVRRGGPSRTLFALFERMDRRATVLLIALVYGAAPPARAQTAPVPDPPLLAADRQAPDQGADQVQTNPQAPKSPANPRRPVWRLFTDIASDFGHLPSIDNAFWLGGGGTTSLLLHPEDGKVNRTLLAKGWVHDAFLPGKIIGYGHTQFGVAAATYTYGRLSKSPRVTHLGVDLIRAQIVTQALTYGIKHSVRRERPDRSSGYSFPSGHASVTFASATVLQRHLGWKYALPTYLIASYVAASRLHENRHFMSDVIFGGTVGIISGRTVTRHGRSHWGFEPTVGSGGAAFLVVRR